MQTLKFSWEVVLVGLIFVRETLTELAGELLSWLDGHFQSVLLVVSVVFLIAGLLISGSIESAAL